MSLSSTGFQAPRKFKIHQAHGDGRVGEHTFTLKSWKVPVIFVFQTVRLPRFHSAGRTLGLQGIFFTEVAYHRCKKLLVPKGQSPGASGSDQPNPTPLQARAHVLLSCSQARVQSGKSCHSSEREVSMGEELTAETRTAAFSGRIEKEPGGDRAAPLRLRD